MRSSPKGRTGLRYPARDGVKTTKKPIRAARGRPFTPTCKSWPVSATPCIPDMQIILNYHLYKHNVGDDYRRMEALCQKLKLIFIPNHAYLYPLDAVMDFVDGTPLSPEACQTLPMLLMTLEEGLAKARQRASLPCPEERCLPINWDCSVRECGVYFHPFLVDNFLDVPFTEIMARKRNSKLCRECKKRAIHQYTSVYLAEKHIDHTESGL